LTLAGFTLLLLTALCMAVANLLIKASITAAGGFTPSLSALFRVCRQPAFIVSFVFSSMAAIMWLRVLATQKLSTCYPLFVSLTYLLITLAAFYLLHERISVQKIAGLIMIIAGITAVSRG
jgi:multidrug transporter EmrE-like cation transporter